jgi:hypothetical protein
MKRYSFDLDLAFARFKMFDSMLIPLLDAATCSTYTYTHSNWGWRFGVGSRGDKNDWMHYSPEFPTSVHSPIFGSLGSKCWIAGSCTYSFSRKWWHHHIKESHVKFLRIHTTYTILMFKPFSIYLVQRLTLSSTEETFYATHPNEPQKDPLEDTTIFLSKTSFPKRGNGGYPLVCGST